MGEFGRFYREKLWETVKKLTLEREISGENEIYARIDGLKQVFTGMETEEWGEIQEKAENREFVQGVVAGYEALFSLQRAVLQSVGVLPTQENTDFALFSSLKVTLLKFNDDFKQIQSEPSLSCSVIVTIYVNLHRKGVLVHRLEREKDCFQGDFSLFPFVYDGNYIKLERREENRAKIMGILAVLTEKTAAKWENAHKLKVERVESSISVLQTQSKPVKTAEIDYKSLFEAVLPPLCSICNQYRSSSVLLQCEKHRCCDAHRASGPFLCPFCMAENSNPPEERENSLNLDREIEEDLVQVTTPHEIDIEIVNQQEGRDEVGSLEPEPAPFLSTDRDVRRCKVCGIDGERVGGCQCACTKCWKKYLETFVVVPEEVGCMGCGGRENGEQAARKAGMQVSNCRKCDSLTCYPCPVNCSNGCSICIPCFRRFYSRLPDLPNSFTTPAAQCCPGCNGACRPSNVSGTHCCDQVLPRVPVITMQRCLHVVHGGCMNRGRCPVCIRERE